MASQQMIDPSRKVLRPDKINKAVLQARHEVRGVITMKAQEYEAQIRAAKAAGQPNPLPFDEIVPCNIGNPQQLKQKPLTYVRQVTALIEYPALMQTAPQAFPPDAIAHAKRLLDSGFISGAYTHSQGHPEIRKDIAAWTTRRDGVPCSPDSIFITDGASTGVKMVLNALIADQTSGIMIPIPQYPLYSASLSLFQGATVPYYLDESKDWALAPGELENAYKEAVKKGVDVRALVAINPNNPTGQVLPLDSMREIVRFCVGHGILLIADEVYQENLYEPGATFTSFRKIAHDLLGDDMVNKIELVNFHSVSKGFFGECGKRGAYFQLDGVLPAARAEFVKMCAINLCPNTIGQVVLDVMVCPPKPGDVSYETFWAERNSILASLKRRAQLICDAFNTMEGYHCCKPTAALYLFPSITLPEKAIEAAKAAGTLPDTFYCLEMLRETGITIVPGSGFGQRLGTFHFRMAFLPPEDQIAGMTGRMAKFHAAFMARYK